MVIMGLGEGRRQAFWLGSFRSLCWTCRSDECDFEVADPLDADLGAVRLGAALDVVPADVGIAIHVGGGDAVQDDRHAAAQLAAAAVCPPEGADYFRAFVQCPTEKYVFLHLSSFFSKSCLLGVVFLETSAAGALDVMYNLLF